MQSRRSVRGWYGTLEALRGVRSLARLFGAASLAALLSGAAASAQASLISDQADYAPGSVAVLSGSGFQPGESVRMQVLHADGAPSGGADHDPWFTDPADANGQFVTTWHVCEDDCVGATLLASADGQDSGLHAEATFTDANLAGAGVVSSVVGVGGSCTSGTPPQSAGPYNYEVVQGGTYTMTITGVSECSGNTITVLASNGVICFTATLTNPGTYVGTFTMPNPACNTYPISYKCGTGACNASGSFDARGPGGNAVHLRAATFDSNCEKTGNDTNCNLDCVPCTPVFPREVRVECGQSTDPSSTGAPTGCSGPGTYRDSTAAGICPVRQVITRVWSVPDGCGNTLTGTQTIIVQDTTPPTIGAAGADDTIECPDSPQFTAPTAFDGCGLSTAVASVVLVSDETTPASCGYSRTKTWKAVDDCGNESGTVSQTITVTDTTPPTIGAAGASTTIECPNAPDFTAPTATDACGAARVVVASDETTPGCGGSYSRTITWKAIDDCGNESGTVSQTIAVADTTPPTIGAAGASDTIECPNTPEFTAPTAVDDCGIATVVVASDETTPGCGGSYSRTITWKAVDDCGNESGTVSQTIAVVDTTPPSLVPPGDVVVNGGTDCCRAVTLGEPTAADDCSGVTFANDAPTQFCVGDTLVTWTATDACGNMDSGTQHVTVLGQICVTKFFDANANGQMDGGEAGVANWQVTVTPVAGTPQTAYTDSSGSVCFDVEAGSYLVAEGMALESNWVATTPTSGAVTVDLGNCHPSVAFGNYCYRAPSNGFTLGYWSNKNGQQILMNVDPQWRTLLNGLNLRNANGTPYTVPTTGNFGTAYNNFRTWLLGATATNMAYMLSAQLAATTLDLNYKGLASSQSIVVPGGLKTQANVCVVPFLSVTQLITHGTPPLLALIPNSQGSTACGCNSPDGVVTIGDLCTRAKNLLGTYGNTVGASTQRTYEECVKNLLDMINNNGNPGGGSAYPCGPLTQYINTSSAACPASF